MLPVARTVSRTSHRRGSHLVRSPSYSGSKQEQSRTTRLLGPVNNFSAAESRIRNPIPGSESAAESEEDTDVAVGDDDDEEEQEGQLPSDNVSSELRSAMWRPRMVNADQQRFFRLCRPAAAMLGKSHVSLTSRCLSMSLSLRSVHERSPG